MPKKIVAFDSQMLNTASACARKFKLYHVDNWRLSGDAHYLDRGDMMHVTMAEYYSLRKEGETDFAKMIVAAGEAGRARAAELNLKPEDTEFYLRAAIENLAFYHNDGWTILWVEQPFSRKIFEDDNVIFLYEGLSDLGVDTAWGPMVVDHKTNKRREDPHKLSNQFMGYSWAFNIPYVVINRVGLQKTLKPQEKHVRQQLSYATQLIEEWVNWTVWRMKQILFYSEKDIWPPDFTSCDKFGGCLFEGACGTVPEAREFKLSASFYKGEPWSPYSKVRKEK